MQTPSESGGGTRDELRADAQQLGSTASNRIHSEIDARKGSAANQAKSVSSAIDRAAGELENSPQWLQSAFQQGATQVRRFAETLEQKDSREILSDVQALARQNPGTFLLGCAAAGFAAARVFKAGAPASSEPDLSQNQSRQPQFPPVQVDEPTFRSTDHSMAAPKRSGEFV